MSYPTTCTDNGDPYPRVDRIIVPIEDDALPPEVACEIRARFADFAPSPTVSVPSLENGGAQFLILWKGDVSGDGVNFEMSSVRSEVGIAAISPDGATLNGSAESVALLVQFVPSDAEMIATGVLGFKGGFRAPLGSGDRGNFVALQVLQLNTTDGACFSQMPLSAVVIYEDDGPGLYYRSPQGKVSASPASQDDLGDAVVNAESLIGWWEVGISNSDGKANDLVLLLDFAPGAASIVGSCG